MKKTTKKETQITKKMVWVRIVKPFVINDRSLEIGDVIEMEDSIAESFGSSVEIVND